MSEECSGSCSSCASKGGCTSQNKNTTQDKIQNKILVLSGKGGVGKSTVAASLAITLAQRGFKVGLLDVDFHGPSQPTLFNVAHVQLGANEAGGIVPTEAEGVKLLSIGLLLENPNAAVIWRGPAKMGVVQQFLNDADWGELDYLILDFPPGTGDEALSASQLIYGNKQAIVVTTPQEMSLADCRKCLDFCAQLKLRVAGVVENMNGFVCPNCHERHDIFSAGGGSRMATTYGLSTLASLPLDPEYMQYCDHGNIPEGLKACPYMAVEFNKIADKLTSK